MPRDLRTIGPLDTDTAPERVLNARARRLENVQLERGYATTLRGNVALPLVAYPSGANRALVAAELPGSSGGLVWLVWNAGGQHSVVRQKQPGAALELLLTWKGLNLPAPGPTTYVPVAVLENFLLYLDADGEVRNLPLNRLAAGEYSPTRLAAEPWGLHVVKVPPMRPLVAGRVTSTNPTAALTARLVPLQAWQFSYRYLYADGEITILAPFTNWLDVMSDPALPASPNAIAVTLPTGIPAGVRELELLVRTPGLADWRVAEVLRPAAGGQWPASYEFIGVTTGRVVTGDDATRLQEYLWPATAMTAARSRLWVGDVRIGYPTPEPPFAADVVPVDSTAQTADIYVLSVEDTQPSDQYPGGTQTVVFNYYYLPASGTYPDPASTYYPLSPYQFSGNTHYTRNPDAVSYAAAFTDPRPGIINETNRGVEVITGAVISDEYPTDELTFHERSTHRVAVQFYDHLGRFAGASQARTVAIPAQVATNMLARAIRCTLTTTDAAALNAEIPAWAAYYQFVVAPNDRTPFFLQGRAADCLAYLGTRRTINPDTGEVQTTEQVADPRTTEHQQLFVDIGNFAAAGLAYRWGGPASGDRLIFLREGVDLPIVDQKGDYLVVNWSSWPTMSATRPRVIEPLIEIYTPNTATDATFYERGPRLAITRTTRPDGTEQRGYERAQVVVPGDCFLASLRFPIIDLSLPDPESGTYVPPSKKQFVSDPAATFQVESMVPPWRLAPVRNTLTTVIAGKSVSIGKSILNGIGGAFSVAGSIVSLDFAGAINTGKTLLDADRFRDEITPRLERTTATTQLDLNSRTAANLLWLDVRYGGRATAQVPLALQQVVQPTVFTHSGARLAGSLLNGLSTWQAFDLREVDQEQAAIMALAPAAEKQSDARVLVAICREGVTSIGIDVARLRQAQGGLLTADTSTVVGYIDSQNTGLGTRHPQTVRGRGGRLYWWCADEAEVCRYARDGTNGLNSQHECRALGQELATAYEGAVTTAAYDPLGEEYWLSFEAVNGAPARTERFSERANGEKGGFVGQYTLAPECLLGTAGRRLLGWKNGQAWEYRPLAPRLTWFGVSYPARVAAWANEGGSAFKQYQALQLESSAHRWELERAETPEGRRTHLPAGGMDRVSDEWQAALQMDETTPDPLAAGTPLPNALYEGNFVQGKALLPTLRCTDTSPDVRLLAVRLDYSTTGGQQPST